MTQGRMVSKVDLFMLSLLTCQNFEI